MKSRQIVIRTASFLPSTAWYLMIWHFSAQSAVDSGAMSDRLLYRMLEDLSRIFRAQSEEGKSAIVSFLSFFERKAAHMFLYFVLMGLLLLALHSFPRKHFFKAAVSFGLCAILAALDELHQYFVPGRSCELRDVAVDLTGGAIFLFLCWLGKCVWLAHHGPGTSGPDK